MSPKLGNDYAKRDSRRLRMGNAFSHRTNINRAGTE
jgi:hypothetical protein